MTDDEIRDALNDAGLEVEGAQPVSADLSPDTGASEAPAEKPKRRLCQGTTKAGKRCRKAPRKGGELCDTCDPTSAGYSRFQAGPDHTVGPGRPPNPRPVDVLREKIESDIEFWLKPYRDTLERAEKFFKMGSAEKGFHLEGVEDLGAKVAVVEKMMDRIYGKPVQPSTLSGPDGAPVEVNLTFADLARLSLSGPSGDDGDA